MPKPIAQDSRIVLTLDAGRTGLKFSAIRGTELLAGPTSRPTEADDRDRCLANIFPLVFSIAVESMPEHTNELSGLMVTAIVGGALLPPLMGLVADHSSVQFSFVVPLAAIVYITATALINLKGGTKVYAEVRQ